jgi:hypothetical protein
MDPALLDRAYDFILRRMVEGGEPPHFSDLARAFSIAPEDGKALLRELMDTGIPCWLYPDTDYIASFAPFNLQPTHYRIAVDGQRRGFGQCGFEALAVTWLYPGRTVAVDSVCLDCGEPIRLEMRDGKLLGSAPAGLHGYVDVPFGEWPKNRAYS